MQTLGPAYPANSRQYKSALSQYDGSRSAAPSPDLFAFALVWPSERPRRSLDLTNPSSTSRKTLSLCDHFLPEPDDEQHETKRDDDSVDEQLRNEGHDVGIQHGTPPAESITADTSDTQYPVHSILLHRLIDDVIELLVQWGGRWLKNDPTWESDDELWETCRETVIRYWCPNGRNHRNRLLRLDPIQGAFTVGRILGEKMVRRTDGTGTEAKYLVDFVGYAKPEWQPADCLTTETIELWRSRAPAENSKNQRKRKR
ncbi:chromodomain protein [Colletotrichum tofieldiae]|uniref:Chromodomain protein n=1 Tax=Colletotrichum tofieldiae TaxID=708197 RepID=A0A166RJQ5_9PEZI|nr:chromodomain protein [Colletotrichum tofieldiae]GKT65230.1 chromodomain protein [Colletotrichum tofieldiae]GKT76864.1 chromodomain protein [Colletotrichum tofieldiae]GKT92692.1 chromodomain protein [Colletotrichum tofieldiae]